MESIKTVFDDECKDVVADAKLLKRLAIYQSSFRTKNEDHIKFFGGKLLGVEVVRFMPADRDVWFQDILKADDDHLTERLHDLPSVNPQFFISSDAMNLSCVWVAHIIANSNLDAKAKRVGMIDVMLILQYKYLTSLLHHYFRYPADRAEAEATYARLSFKFLIKNYDSWFALLYALAEQTIEPAENGRRDPERVSYRKVIEKMDNDEHIRDMVNYIQGRIRSMIKNIYAEFMLVHKQGVKIASTSALVTFDGEELLRDRQRGLENYIRYIQSVVGDQASFIRVELTKVIEKIMGSMNPRLFEQCLVWMSQNYRHSTAGVIDELLSETLIHSFGYLSEHTTLVRNSHDLPGILSRLRGTYMSSRSTDVTLLGLREKAEKLVRLATNNKNSNTVAALRTGILLYIVLRTFTMQHFSQSSVE